MAEFYLSWYACKKVLGESSAEVIRSRARRFISSESAGRNAVNGVKSHNPINDAITSRLDETS